MNNPIKIAVDAMGGENSPGKIIKGIKIHSSQTKNIYYNIFGNKNLIEPLVQKHKIPENIYQIVHTENLIEDSDSPLSAAKKGKDTSMWLSIESLKIKSQMLLFQQETLVLVCYSKTKFKND